MLIQEVAKGISKLESMVITKEDDGDMIILRDEEGKSRYVYRGLKTYKIIKGKEVLWDVEKNQPYKVG